MAHEAPQPSEQGPYRSVAALFEHIARRLPHRSKRDIEVSYKFVVTGASGGMWFIELTKDGGGGVSNEDRRADLTITVDANTLLEIVNAPNDAMKNVLTAFVLGRIKAKGNLELALHFRSLLTHA